MWYCSHTHPFHSFLEPMRSQDAWISFRFFVAAIALEVFPVDNLFGSAYEIPRRHVIQSILILSAMVILWCAEIESREEEILVSFYHNTNGKAWKTSRNWCTERRSGTWTGVRSTNTGRIKGVWLESNNLSGFNNFISWVDNSGWRAPFPFIYPCTRVNY